MNSQDIMNVLEKNHENLNGWIFTREYGFDQYKKGSVSICLALAYEGGADNELTIQVTNNEGGEVCNKVVLLEEVSTDNVLVEVRKTMDEVSEYFFV